MSNEALNEMFAAMFGALPAHDMHTTAGQLDDVESALNALPPEHEIVASAAKDPTTLRFKVVVPNGHLEADVPVSMHYLVARAMRESLESRRAELLVQLSKESEANG